MKVFKISECDWVCAKDFDVAIEYYEGLTGESVDVEEIEECDIETEGSWVEVEEGVNVTLEEALHIVKLDSDGVKEEIIRDNNDSKKIKFGSFKKFGGSWWIYLPYKDSISEKETEPFIIASTEW